MTSTGSLTPAKLFDLTGRVALVTGGGTGIGLMQAQGLAAAGAKVYIVGRTLEVLEKSCQLYSTSKEGGGSMHPLQGDVTDKASIKKLANEIEKAEGKLNILFSNAGGPGPTHFGSDTSAPDKFGDRESTDPHKNPEHPISASDYSKRVLEANTFENWDELFRLNTHAAFFVFATFLPLLSKGSEKAKEAGKNYSSCFVTTGSISGMVKQSQLHYAYNASKAAVNHLTRAMAYEATSSTTANVRVNAIAPGVFPSQMTQDGKDDETNKSTLKDKLPTMAIPAGRPGREADMAQASVFVASCEYFHGQVLPVDGGFTLTEP